MAKTTDGIVTSWNPAAERLYGYRADEIVGRSVGLIVPADRWEQELQILADAAAGRQLARYETERRRKDGSIVSVALTVSPILDASNRVQGVSAISSDITERKRSEQALLVQQRRTRAIIDTATDTFVAMDEQGLITEWNRAAELTFGWSRDEAVGRRLSDTIVPHRYRDAHEQGRSRVVASGDTHVLGERVEIQASHRDGTELDVELSSWRAEGADGGFNAFLRDITERKRFERELADARDQALAGSTAKSEFLATMSHEIRTPMNGVIGLTGLLLDTSLDEVQRRYATGVRGAGEALLGIIDDILDFSKLEAGAVELEDLPFDPRQLVEEVGLLLAGAAADKRLELIAFCAPDVPTSLRGDAGRLRQVLINLASNAVKFTDAGEVVLQARLRSLADGRAVVEFSVTDSGIGIAADDQERLFEPFSQADASTTRRFGGTGLGLAICRRLVSAMHGELAVQSAPGAGSTFSFTVRLEVCSPSAAAPAGTPAPLRGLRVLVVDDNATNRLILHDQLAAWQMNTDTAADAEAGWRLLQVAAAQGRPYDVAALDMCMPDVNGLELAARISAQHPDVRIMILTSAGPLQRDRLDAAGVRACVSKPVRSSDLHDALTQLAVGDVRVEDGAAPPRAPAAGNGLGRVLVVEDNEVNQLVAEGVLHSLGYDVELAGNGREALVALSGAAYVAVLMDCHMPEMDGYEATAELRRREAGAGRRTPVIAMTAGVLAEDRERCTAAGMDDFVPKPVDVGLLGRTLARWVADPDAPRTAPVPAREPDRPDVLDHSRLDVLRRIGAGDGWGLLPTVIDAFLASAPEHARAVRAAHLSGDAAQLETVLHRLRGSAANLGAEVLSASCDHLERSARTGTLPAPEDLDRVERELAEACRALETLMVART